MPLRRELNPVDWPAISLRIRNREGWRCRWCGIERGSTATKSGKSVVLTVAHINHDTTSNVEDNLAALCQRYHLEHDLPHHKANAAETRRRRRRSAGQLDLMGPSE